MHKLRNQLGSSAARIAPVRDAAEPHEVSRERRRCPRKRREHFGDKFLRLDRDLEAGMCVTIEPGIYLVPAIWENETLVKPFADVVNRSAVEALLKEQFGGIRIEETIHVTADGPEVLSAALPSEAEEVARCLGGG